MTEPKIPYQNIDPHMDFDKENGQELEPSFVVPTGKDNPTTPAPTSAEQQSNNNEIREMVQGVATELDQILEGIKGSAKTILDEISHFLHEGHRVADDWKKAQETEHQEAARIDQVKPDVQGMVMTPWNSSAFPQVASKHESNGTT